MATPDTQELLDRLLNVAIGVAQHGLEQNGEFFPFGAGIGASGKPELILCDPRADDVVASAEDALRARRDELQAAALVCDVLADGDETIYVDLCFPDGEAITVLLPYAKGGDDGGLTFGKQRRGAGRLRLWPAT